jgi:hypothetical protein
MFRALFRQNAAAAFNGVVAAKHPRGSRILSPQHEAMNRDKINAGRLQRAKKIGPSDGMAVQGTIWLSYPTRGKEEY